MTKKFLIVIAAVMSVTIALAGCSWSGQETAASSDDEEQQAPATDQQDQPQAVRYFSVENNPAVGEAVSFGHDRYAVALETDAADFEAYGREDLGQSRFGDANGSDPALAAAHAYYLDAVVIAPYNVAHPDDQVQPILNVGETADEAHLRFLADQEAWQAAANRLAELEGESTAEVRELAGYKSQMYMVNGAVEHSIETINGSLNAIPAIVSQESSLSGGHELRFTHPLLGEFAYRWECGWQPETTGWWRPGTPCPPTPKPPKPPTPKPDPDPDKPKPDKKKVKDEPSKKAPAVDEEDGKQDNKGPSEPEGDKPKTEKPAVCQHDFGSWTADPGNAGYEFRTCKKCGYTESRKAPASTTPHEHQWVKFVDEPAEPGVQGRGYWKCAICGTKKPGSDFVIPALPKPQPGAGTPDKPANIPPPQDDAVGSTEAPKKGSVAPAAEPASEEPSPPAGTPPPDDKVVAPTDTAPGQPQPQPGAGTPDKPASIPAPEG
jgi:hypothetical protein